MGTIVSHIGMTERDVRLIKSIFMLSPKLNTGFEFVDSGNWQADVQRADVLFVNADNPASLDLWQALQSQNRLITPILVSSTKPDGSRRDTLMRPLVLRRVVEALETATRPALKSRAERRLGTNCLKVLIVDDSFPVRKYMEQKLPQLTSWALALDFAASGEEAIDKMDQHNYDLIFLDVVMPGTNGYKVCKRIKSAHTCYVVMLTSKKSPFDKVRGTMSGCDAYVTKPPDDDRLKRILEACAQFRTNHQLEDTPFPGAHFGPT